MLGQANMIYEAPGIMKGPNPEPATVTETPRKTGHYLATPSVALGKMD